MRFKSFKNGFKPGCSRIERVVSGSIPQLCNKRLKMNDDSQLADWNDTLHNKGDSRGSQPGCRSTLRSRFLCTKVVDDDLIDFLLEQRQSNVSTLLEEEFWKHIPHSGLLYKITNATWNEFVRSHEKVLVTIYREDCPNCKDMRKHLAQCAKKLFQEKMNVQLSVLDSDKYSDNIHRLWTEDMGVPTLFWYEKGIKRFEYINSREASDLFKFVLNPTKSEPKASYPDWSMAETAESIFHYKDSGFNEFARDQEDMMVFFYSPSCRDCFKLRKIYEEAATILDDEKPSVAMTAVNVAEALVLKNKYPIDSYPFFAYFRNGVYKYQYNGKHAVVDIVKFMKKPKYIEKKITSESWGDGGSNVTMLTVESFDFFINSHDHVMVMFFTKWCGHCKYFKPHYQKAADRLKERKSQAQLAALDSADASQFLKKYEVYGFPTMLYFNNGDLAKKYTGKRTSEDVMNFMLDASEEVGSDQIDVEDEIKLRKPPQVGALSPQNLTDFLSSNDESFIMFYSPSCGACKEAMKGFYDAAVEAAAEDRNDIGLGIFNALLHRNDVSDFDIKGYPTFWYFVGKHKKFKYRGDFTTKAFLDFIDNPKEMEDIKSRDSPKQWISEVSQVEHPNIKNFDKFLAKYSRVMVFFYINVCEICLNTIKPEYTKAADILHEERHTSTKLAAINGGWERELMKKYNVDSFPTLLYFQDGDLKYQYHGSWRAKDLVKFMKNPKADLAKKVKPTSWQDMTSEDYGRVIHLGNKTYDQFIRSSNKALVLFHSLYYQRCVKAREAFKSASEELAGGSEISFGAVDCHRKPEQGLVCYHLSVKKFPLLKYYEDGQFASDFTLENIDDFTEFVKKRLLSGETQSKDEL